MQTDIQARGITSTTWQALTIDNDFVPVQIETPPTLTEPIDDVTTTYFDLVDFSWEVVPNADGYLFEIDIANNFSLNPKRIAVSTNSVSMTNLEADTKYYWRVTPYSKGSYCNLVTSTSSFTTGLSVGIDNPLDPSELQVSAVPSLFQNSFTVNIFQNRLVT